MRYLLGFVIPLCLAACSINSTVEVQTTQSDSKPDEAGKPEGQSGSGESSEPSDPADSGSMSSDDPMYTMKGFPKGTLGAELEGFSRIKVLHQDWSNGPENKTTKAGETSEYSDMREIFRLINPKQTPTEAAATCLFSHMIDFVDNNGKIVGRVGMCDTPEYRRKQPGALIKFSVRGKQTGRRGITITSAPALAKAVEKHATK